MNETAVLPDLLRHGGEKGDHIVLRRLLDLIDSVHVESGPFADIPHRGLRDFPRSAMASQARISISSQRRYRFSGLQIASIFAREYRCINLLLLFRSTLTGEPDTHFGSTRQKATKKHPESQVIYYESASESRNLRAFKYPG